MNVSIEVMEQRLEQAKAEREKMIGNLNLLQGRIVEIEAVIAHLKAEEPEDARAEA